MATLGSLPRQRGRRESGRENNRCPLCCVTKIILVVGIEGLEATEQGAGCGHDRYLALKAALADVLFLRKQFSAYFRGRILARQVFCPDRVSHRALPLVEERKQSAQIGAGSKQHSGQKWAAPSSCWSWEAAIRRASAGCRARGNKTRRRHPPRVKAETVRRTVRAALR